MRGLPNASGTRQEIVHEILRYHAREPNDASEFIPHDEPYIYPEGLDRYLAVSRMWVPYSSTHVNCNHFTTDEGKPYTVFQGKQSNFRERKRGLECR